MKRLTEEQISKLVTRILIIVLVLIVLVVAFFIVRSIISPKLANQKAERKILDAISSNNGTAMVEIYKEYASTEQYSIILKYVDELAIDAMTDMVLNNFDSGNDMENYINNAYGTLFFYNDNQNLVGDFSDTFYDFFNILYKYYNNDYISDIEFVAFEMSCLNMEMNGHLRYAAENMSDFEKNNLSKKYSNIKDKIEKIKEEKDLND